MVLLRHAYMRYSTRIRPYIISHSLISATTMATSTAAVMSSAAITCSSPSTSMSVTSMVEQWLKEVSKESHTCVLSDVSHVSKSELIALHGHAERLLDSGHPLLDSLTSCGAANLSPARLHGTLVLLIGLGHSSGNSISMSTRRHKSLAEITEMIITASQMHSSLQCAHRKTPLSMSIPSPSTGAASSSSSSCSRSSSQLGDMLAVLSGDFLLARACSVLAQLNDVRVTALMSDAIGDMAVSRTMQLHPSGLMNISTLASDNMMHSNSNNKDNINDLKIDHKVVAHIGEELNIDKERSFIDMANDYYSKSSSVVAKSCQASLLLSLPLTNRRTLYNDVVVVGRIGRHLSRAFEILCDIEACRSSLKLFSLTNDDFSSSMEMFRKKPTTAVTLMAARESPNIILPALLSGFCTAGPVELREFIRVESRALSAATALAKVNCVIAKVLLREKHTSMRRRRIGTSVESRRAMVMLNVLAHRLHHCSLGI